VRRVVGKLSVRAVTSVRDRALIWTMFYGGFRCAEALDMKLADLDFESDAPDVVFVIPKGKGNKRRTGGLPAEVGDKIREWMEVRRARGIPDDVPVFCSLRGQRMDTSVVRKKFAALGKAAGLSKRFHAHGLRHTLAISLVEEGASLTDIRTILGHSSVVTTDKYLNHIKPARAIKIMQKRGYKANAQQNGNKVDSGNSHDARLE
jgi:site-specific recombinase XerD